MAKHIHRIDGLKIDCLWFLPFQQCKIPVAKHSLRFGELGLAIHAAAGESEGGERRRLSMIDVSTSLRLAWSLRVSRNNPL